MSAQQQQRGRGMTRAARALVGTALAASLLAFSFGACSLGEGKTPACNPDAPKDDPNACQPVAACDDGTGFSLPTNDCCGQVAERAIADCLRIESVSITVAGQGEIVECSPGGELEGDTCPEGGSTGRSVCDIGTAAVAACMTRVVGQGGGGSGGAGGAGGGGGAGGAGGQGGAAGGGGTGGAGGN